MQFQLKSQKELVKMTFKFISKLKVQEKCCNWGERNGDRYDEGIYWEDQSYQDVLYIGLGMGT